MLVVYLFVPAATAVLLIAATGFVPKDAISPTIKRLLLLVYRVLLICLLIFIFFEWKAGRIILECWGILILPGPLGKILSSLYPQNRSVYYKTMFFYFAALFVWNGFRSSRADLAR